MSALLDENVQAVGEDVRQLARMHVELARTEVREGATRFVRGMFLFGFGVASGGLVLVAAGIALFSLLGGLMAPAAAVATVGIIYLAVSVAALWIGWRWIRGIASLLLPRTRALLWELITCRDKRSAS